MNPDSEIRKSIAVLMQTMRDARRLTKELASQIRELDEKLKRIKEATRNAKDRHLNYFERLHQSKTGACHPADIGMTQLALISIRQGGHTSAERGSSKPTRQEAALPSSPPEETLHHLHTTTPRARQP